MTTAQSLVDVENALYTVLNRVGNYKGEQRESRIGEYQVYYQGDDNATNMSVTRHYPRARIHGYVIINHGTGQIHMDIQKDSLLGRSIAMSATQRRWLEQHGYDHVHRGHYEKTVR